MFLLKIKVADQMSTYCLFFIFISIMSVNGVYCEQMSSSNVVVLNSQVHNGEGGGGGCSKVVYIVYMGSLPDHSDYSPTSHHENILQDLLEGSSSLIEESLVHSYKRSFNGFAAKLTEKEAEKLLLLLLQGHHEGIVSVFPSRNLQLETSRSWDFMGLNETAKRNPTIESNIVIGVLDTGIWPESESFSDQGFGPPPKKWKGVCQGGKNFTCNNKLIGARYYTSDNTTRDTDGHGTHTSSTAAGNAVKGASFYGLAEGTARGAVPSARIAVYKACDPYCAVEDILKAFDDAIADGVDIISASFGGSKNTEMDNDCVAIGAFHAMEKGILTIQSAGNNGPISQTVTSAAPWLLTVAASTIDRRFPDKVVLGDGTTLVGSAINTFQMNGTKFPLVYGNDVSSSCDPCSYQAWQVGCIDTSLVKGKIVVCDSFSNGLGAVSAGALGIITGNALYHDYAFILPLPASQFTPENFKKLKSYINSTKNPVATILKTETTKDTQAPVVASFSSRGPSYLVPDILKPDITAPGVDILAAWSPIVPPTESTLDTRAPKYSIISGTSMSCPHVSGAAAYVKTFHPKWSPSAIKSALMTTAWIMNDTMHEDGEFAYGAGHINPVKAVHPGLVYEASKEDYINFLCNIGYHTSRVRLLTKGSCPEKPKGTAKELNYPSMSALVNERFSFEVKFSRTVTNVGLENSTYKAKITSSNKIKISVTPNILSFKRLGEKKSFVVSASGESLGYQNFESGALVWSDGVYSVRSPINVHTMQPSNDQTKKSVINLLCIFCLFFTLLN